jgi:hypothetical protein
MRGIRCFGLGRECGRATGVPRCGLTTESTVNAKQILPGIHAHPGISFNAACRASSRLLMSTFRAGTRTPVNFRRHGRPKPKPLLAASCATVIRLLPCSGVGCPSLVHDQADRFVLDGRETRLCPGRWTTRQQGSEGSDQALHDSQYGQTMGRVNEHPRRSKKQRQVGGVITLSKFAGTGGATP